VHNNFYFLRQLSASLEPILRDAVVSECFSQSKEELIIRFETSAAPFLIKASLSPAFSCLSFPDNFQRARRNSVDLFPDLIGRRVGGVRQFKNERSFALQLSDGLHLLFKMHGNRTNIILFQDLLPPERFRNNLLADADIRLENLDREIDWSFENFKQHSTNLKSQYFTFGKILWQYLADNGFSGQTVEAQWTMIQSLLQSLQTPSYYITFLKNTPALSLVETGEVKKVWHEPILAANDFYHTFTHLHAGDKEKTALLSFLKTRLDAGNHYREKNLLRLQTLENDNNYKVWADLLMANLHVVEPRSEKVILANFYNDNLPAEIKLKRDLSPQKNAEVFYKKAKNQHLEIERLKESNLQKEKEIAVIKVRIAMVESASDLKTLRTMKAGIDPGGSGKKQETSLPYHEFEFNGYKIWVGKNAQANDVLTLKYGYKEDLWLHARDVAGSHVLIKYQSGKNFPKDVIEHAASLAAFHSKRKNESLCPVIVTPKKFVRKRKGDPAGAVVVEREEVVMAVPSRFR
jgi:hypothetical protein